MSNYNYNSKHYDRVGLFLPKGWTMQPKERAKQLHVSFSQYIKDAVEKYMQDDGLIPSCLYVITKPDGGEEVCNWSSLLKVALSQVHCIKSYQVQSAETAFREMADTACQLQNSEMGAHLFKQFMDSILPASSSLRLSDLICLRCIDADNNTYFVISSDVDELVNAVFNHYNIHAHVTKKED